MEERLRDHWGMQVKDGISWDRRSCAPSKCQHVSFHPGGQMAKIDFEDQHALLPRARSAYSPMVET